MRKTNKFIQTLSPQHEPNNLTMYDYITYLTSIIHSYLYQTYGGSVRTVDDFKIEYIETRYHAKLKGEIAIYNVKGFRWEAWFEGQIDDSGYEVEEEDYLPGNWEPIMIEIGLNTQGGICMIDYYDRALEKPQNAQLSFSKPESMDF